MNAIWHYAYRQWHSRACWKCDVSFCAADKLSGKRKHEGERRAMQIDMKVLQLLCSRLCHDLVGPAGAIHNGMELLAEIAPDGGAGDTDMAGALGLVEASVGQLSGRLAFFRMAFGLGGLTGKKAILAETRDIVKNFLSGGRISLDWSETVAGDGTADVSADSAKLLVNMILIGAEALPRGGVLGVVAAPMGELQPGTGLAVMANGEGARMKAETLAIIGSGGAREGVSGEHPELSAHTVQAYFAQSLAQSLGTSIEVSAAENEIQLAALVPVRFEG